MINFLIRAWNFFFGWLGLGISALEAQNPEVVYMNAISALTRRHEAAHDATSKVKAREKDLLKRKKSLTDAVAQDQRDLDLAIDSNQDALAKLLIDKQEQNQASLLEVETDLGVVEQDLNDAINGLEEVEKEIKKLNDEKASMLSRLRTAESRAELKRALSGLSTSAEAQALRGVRESIDQKTAAVDLDRDIKKRSVEGQLKALREKSSTEEADRKLAEMKAARARKQAS